VNPILWQKHGRIDLALHVLADRAPAHRPLLLLHGLGERTIAGLPWPLSHFGGSVYGLDFTGHGLSTVAHGGGYTAEMLMADAHVAAFALSERHTLPPLVLGRGLGGYVGLLLAGADPTHVGGVVIADGPGLTGGGARPPSLYIGSDLRPSDETPDPFALMELAGDVRPPDYAVMMINLAAAAQRPVPVAVSAKNRPEWLSAVVEQPGVRELSIDVALGMLG
jgi:pimeloyl-ACP methyl ester carboxylesterase